MLYLVSDCQVLRGIFSKYPKGVFNEIEIMITGLLGYSKFKVDDRVVLLRTPVITGEENWGWQRGKHFLVEGAAGTVKDLGYSKHGFYYMIAFDNDSWIDPVTRERKVADTPGHYMFYESWLGKA
jgi:hypothetical protein